MEIKIVCAACGTRFAFEVEPVHGRMPAPVNCPECGTDATQEANAVIQSTLAANAPSHPPAAIPQPALASAPSAGPLRINRPAVPAPQPLAPPAEDYTETPTAPPRFSTAPSSRSSGGKSTFIKALSTVLIVLCAGFGAWRIGLKWFKRLNVIAEIASAVGEASVNKGDSEDGGARNLAYDDAALLFIQHSNHLEVANACKAFWKDQFHRDLAIVNQLQDAENPGEYEVIAAHNGYVRIIGLFQWPVSEHEALAQHLSQKFGARVFEWRSEHVADTYHFGVYDQGTRKFHAQMDIKVIKGDPIEKVTTEGNDFAIANGYKPGPEGFKEFNVLDADKITQRLGMKMWDEKEEVTPQGVLLREVGVRAAQ